MGEEPCSLSFGCQEAFNRAPGKVLPHGWLKQVHSLDRPCREQTLSLGRERCPFVTGNHRSKSVSDSVLDTTQDLVVARRTNLSVQRDIQCGKPTNRPHRFPLIANTNGYRSRYRETAPCPLRHNVLTSARSVFTTQETDHGERIPHQLGLDARRLD
jgi:hypothetical protein